MTVLRHTPHPTYEDLVALWQQAPAPRTARRRRAPVMVMGWMVTLSSMAGIYLALLWAIDVVGR